MQAYRYPSGSSNVNISAIGTNGAPIPDDSILVAGENPSGNLQPLQTDADGSLLIAEADPTIARHVIVDSSALPLGASTSALQTSGNASLTSIDGKTPALGQALAAASVPVVLTAAQISTLTPLTSVTVTQATGTNLHAVIDNFPATQPISGSVTVVQPTGTNLHTVVDSGSITVTQATGTNLHTVVDSGSITANAGTNLNTSALNLETTQTAMSAKLPATLGQKASTASMAVVLASDQSSVPVAATPAVPPALTVKQAAISVGTSAVRLTTDGSAPSSTRRVLIANVDSAATAKFYIGSSSVTASSTTRGIQLTANQTFNASDDAGDYYIISDTAAQTVFVTEQE